MPPRSYPLDRKYATPRTARDQSPETAAPARMDAYRVFGGEPLHNDARNACPPRRMPRISLPAPAGACRNWRKGHRMTTAPTSVPKPVGRASGGVRVRALQEQGGKIVIS